MNTTMEQCLTCPLHGAACGRYTGPECLRIHVQMCLNQCREPSISRNKHNDDNLRQQQDREYRQSLKADKRKQRVREKQQRQENRLIDSRTRLLKRHEQDMARRVRNRVCLRFTFRNMPAVTIDFVPRHNLLMLIALLHNHAASHVTTFEPMGLFDPTTRQTICFTEHRGKTLRDLNILSARRLMVLEND